MTVLLLVLCIILVAVGLAVLIDAEWPSHEGEDGEVDDGDWDDW